MLYIFSVTILDMQNSTPPVKAETCRSINQQTKSVMQNVGFQRYISDSTVSRPHYLPHSFVTASAYSCLASELNALRTVRNTVTLHRVLWSQFNIQTTAATCTPLNTCNTLTPSPSQLELIFAGDQLAIHRRPTGDPPHRTQFPVLTAAPQFGCTGTDSLLQRARFTV